MKGLPYCMSPLRRPTRRGSNDGDCGGSGQCKLGGKKTESLNKTKQIEQSIILTVISGSVEVI